MVLGSLFSVTGVSFLMFCVFTVAALGYLLGRVTIKGVNLGTAGVFVVALLFGCFCYKPLEAQLMLAGNSYVGNALKILENLGLMLFVTSVGFIAGPNFFSGLKKNFKSYILLGAVIILSGALACVACIVLFGCEPSMAVGLLAGALTSTPAFSAAKETVQVVATSPEMAVELENMVTVGYGIAYLFGVVGVVLFVQLVPKLLKANMADEVAKLTKANSGETRKELTGLVEIDNFGFAPFAIAVLCGIIVGGIKIPMGNSNFSLGTTGGTLLASLTIAHFGHIGKLSMKVQTSVLKTFRELGLMMFLMGAGIPGGAHFVEYFAPKYFIFGMLMTIAPMVGGYIIAVKVQNLSTLNALGSITGGMTSTPALGTLINVSGTDDVASAYAATYPVALVLVVLVSQFIILLF